MFSDNFRRDELRDGEATQRDHYPVIGVPHHRNKIWYQVDGAQSISSYTNGECLCMPGHTTVPHGEINSVRLPLSTPYPRNTLRTARCHLLLPTKPRACLS